MKKILFCSFFLIATATMSSCTADETPTSQSAPENLEGDTGGQSGQLPPPKP